MPLQQSLLDLQAWPKRAQIPPSAGGGGGVVASLVPASVRGVPASDGGGGGIATQDPLVEPGAVTHIDPTQQSPLMVHEPPAGMQVPPSGPCKHRSTPLGSGTQGTRSQQSADDAHVSATLRQVPSPWHRGTPSGSSWQAPELPTAPQQSFRADEMLQG